MPEGCGMRQGAARHALAERGNDLYETPACATRALIQSGEIDRHGFDIDLLIWEPCAGRGAIVRELEQKGLYDCVAQDLVAYPDAHPLIEAPRDFLLEREPLGDVIVTNPPYKLADKFIRHGLSLDLPVIVLLRLMALEGANRSDLIDKHLRRVWVGIERLPMMHREGWAGSKISSGGMPFAWFVFEPGERIGAIELRRMSWRA